MQVRQTVRILLFDPSSRLLLMRVNNPSLSDPALRGAESLWATIGGRLEAGEDHFSAALRELREETGIDQSSLASVGPKVWFGEQVLTVNQEQTLFCETFIVVRTTAAELHFEEQTAEEKRVIREMRWWTVEDIMKTEDTIVPYVLRQLIANVAAGKYPDEVLRIDLSATPKSVGI
jgi:8-oxo-dGTP pyrophosphatase MutT (NUDIX family)